MDGAVRARNQMQQQLDAARARLAAVIGGGLPAGAAGRVTVDLPRPAIGRRLVAHGIDAFWVLLLSGLLSIALRVLAFGIFGITLRATTLAVLTGTTLVGVLYSAWSYAGPRRATAGKRAMGIEVRGMDGRPVTFPRGLLHAAAFAGSVAFMLPVAILVPLFRQDQRGLHEIVAGTQTVLAKHAPAVAPAMSTFSAGSPWGQPAHATAKAPAPPRAEPVAVLSPAETGRASVKKKPPATTDQSAVVRRRR